MGSYRARLMPHGQRRVRRPSCGNYVDDHAFQLRDMFKRVQASGKLESWATLVGLQITRQINEQPKVRPTPLTKFRRSNQGKQPTCRRVSQTPCCEEAGRVVQTCALSVGAMKV